MAYMNARTIRVGFVILVTAVMTVGIYDDATAKEGKKHAPDEEAASSQTARLGPLRFYGGPKSPMWREVR
jgi:hypothetical protein